MRPDYYLTQNDVPVEPLEVVLLNSRLQPVDLSGASQVLFHMRAVRGGMAPLVRSASIVNPPGVDGKVRYEWQAEDTAVAGDYWGEFQVTWTSGGKITSHPTWPKLVIRVVPEVA